MYGFYCPLQHIFYQFEDEAAYLEFLDFIKSEAEGASPAGQMEEILESNSAAHGSNSISIVETKEDAQQRLSQDLFADSANWRGNRLLWFISAMYRSSLINLQV